ncbi:MAG: flavodoxin family protein [Oscillospiraceae bacterium]|nr:flavodoxin family protein [Oscillospiraceae bacterium]MBQ4457120.1 flavodoxin family protein [Clostridia bacterium]
MKVLLVNGSPHKNGNTSKALSIIEAALHERDIQTEWFQLSAKPVRGCIACEKCRETYRCVFEDDQANELIEKIIACDGVVIGSPVYFAGPNGALLALLDRVFYAGSCHGRLFKGKIGAAAVTLWRAGSTAALDRLYKYFSYSEMPIVSSDYWNMLHIGNDQTGEDILRRLGRNMAELLDRSIKKRGSDIWTSWIFQRSG